jgi:hypothetical protein
MARDVIVERGHRANHASNYSSPARTYALVFGIAYLIVAATEVFLNFSGQELVVGGYTVLHFSLVHNIIHWATGLVLVMAATMRNWNTRAVVLTVGIVFLLVALLGFVAKDALDGILMENMPFFYNWVHLATGALGVICGLVGAHTGTRRTHGTV